MRLGINGHQTPQAQHSPLRLGSHPIAQLPQPKGHLGHPVKRMTRVFLVQQNACSAGFVATPAPPSNNSWTGQAPAVGTAAPSTNADVKNRSMSGAAQGSS